MSGEWVAPLVVAGCLLAAAAFFAWTAIDRWRLDRQLRQIDAETQCVCDWCWPTGITISPFDWQSPDRWCTKWLREGGDESARVATPTEARHSL